MGGCTRGFGRDGGFGASNRTGWLQFGQRSHAPDATPSAFKTVPQLGQRNAGVATGDDFVDSDSSTGTAPDGRLARQFDLQQFTFTPRPEKKDAYPARETVPGDRQPEEGA
jgi:hypothetical protein